MASKKKPKTTKVKVEDVEIEMIIDSGSSINIVDLDTFNRIKKRNKNLTLISTKTKIFPYASQPLKTAGYFNATIETDKRITTDKVFVIEHNSAGNLLGIQSAIQLNLFKINDLQDTSIK